MEPATASFTRRSGVAYARAPAGYELPVIDVTDPAFRLAEDPDTLAALQEAYRAEERRYRRLPAFLLRLLWRSAARRSLLLRALLKPEAGYLGGLATYVMKLGADNLVPPFDTALDRRLAAAPFAISMRLRLQQVAALAAEGLQPVLAARPGATLHLINIAGGPAADSLNALILLHAADPALLARPVRIHVLDLDAEGPRFGAAALAALQTPGNPLAGLDIAFCHLAYDWNDTAVLTRLLRDLAAAPAVVAATSEGGLFEYGSDAAVAANLAALHEGGASAVAGSVTRADAFTRRALSASRFKLVPRGTEVFAALAEPAGWRLARCKPSLISDQVLLTPT
jgi:hypothetical protein